MLTKKLSYSPFHYLSAWAVHIFTASAACFGILTLIKIYQHDYILALWFMAVTIIIDALDGTLARLFRVKVVLPNMDGTLLDNLVDYLNYVITPCFFLYVNADMLPASYSMYIIIAVILTSSYQFCQVDAKTPDHFFKGFPCYWNIALFYMFTLSTSKYTNAYLLIALCCMVFIPIKYVYPSRLDYLTKFKALKLLMHLFSLIFGISSAMMLWYYPTANPIWLILSLGYVVMYLLLSLYRTFYPLEEL